jgi:hypothetical protein
MRKGISLVLLLLGLSAMLVADSRARIVRLSYLEGDVELDRRDGRGYQRAFLNMPIIEGARLWTHNDGRSEIEFEDGSTLRLAPQTIVEFSQLGLHDGHRITHIEVQEGTIYGNVQKRRDDDFRITFAQDAVLLDKSTRFRLELNQAEVKLSVFRGGLGLQRFNGEHVEVRNNETVSISFDDRDRYYLAKGIEEGPHDYWDRDREEDRSRNAANEAASSSSLSYSGYSTVSSYGYPAGYAYGYPDLYAYGSFFNVAGYGYLWRPFSVSFGWSPFADGSWVLYPRFGYVWVSPYPWGWVPFRYGSWVFVNNRGWCWRGGHNFNTWSTITNVHNAPPNFTHPIRPAGVPANSGGVINVGRGGSPLPISPENRPVVSGGRPVDASNRGGPRDDVRADGPRDIRGRRNGSEVITNENLGAHINATPTRNPAPTSGDGNERPTPAARETARPANGSGVASDSGERPVRTRATRDPDYNAVDYRRTNTNDGLSIEGGSRTAPPRMPSDAGIDRADRVVGGTGGPMPAASDRGSGPVTTGDRTPGPMQQGSVDRGDRPMRTGMPSPPVRSAPMPAAGGSPAGSSPSSGGHPASPSTSSPGPVHMSAPPPSAPPASAPARSAPSAPARSAPSPRASREVSQRPHAN